MNCFEVQEIGDTGKYLVINTKTKEAISRNSHIQWSDPVYIQKHCIFDSRRGADERVHSANKQYWEHTNEINRQRYEVEGIKTALKGKTIKHPEPQIPDNEPIYNTKFSLPKIKLPKIKLWKVKK